ncbi:MAG TPA: PIN domain-containing protein [Terriglobales bacterium]|jgi:predicted nucleic acid-binding protein|nr:PIN domain-containing protein [Terriglobales bacterium]
MAVSVTGKVLLDTNVFIDYLRADLHADWIFGGMSNTIRFLSAVVLMELRLGANTTRRRRAVDRIQTAFPAGRLIAPLPALFDHAGRLFRTIHGDGSGLADRLGSINDLLIALTARHMGATVVTSNLQEFYQISVYLSGLKIAAPEDRAL